MTEVLVSSTVLILALAALRLLLRGRIDPRLLSAVHKEKGEEKLHLVMLDDAIPAGSKLC